MPTMTAIQISASDVRKDDIMWHGSNAYTVIVNVRKPVWSYIEVEEIDKAIRIQCDDVVTVERMIKSDEEIAVEARAWMNTAIKKIADGAQAAFDVAAAKIAIDPSNWTIEKLISARRTQELYAMIERVAAHQEIDYVAAAEEVVARTRNDLLNFRAASQSTSVVSNAVDAVRFDVDAAFCRTVLYGF